MKNLLIAMAAAGTFALLGVQAKAHDGCYENRASEEGYYRGYDGDRYEHRRYRYEGDDGDVVIHRRYYAVPDEDCGYRHRSRRASVRFFFGF